MMVVEENQDGDEDQRRDQTGKKGRLGGKKPLEVNLVDEICRIRLQAMQCKKHSKRGAVDRFGGSVVRWFGERQRARCARMQLDQGGDGGERRMVRDRDSCKDRRAEAE